MGRPKKINIEELSDSQIEQLSSTVGELVNKDLNKTLSALQKKLKRYGLTMHVLYEIKPEDSKPSWEDVNWYKNALVKSLENFNKNNAENGSKPDIC